LGEAKVFLKMCFAIAVFSIVAFDACCAQDVPDKTMINTLRCEAGRIGEKMLVAKLPEDQQVIVTWKSTKTTSSAGGIGLKFPIFSFGGSGDLSKEDLDEANSEGLPFNLNRANAVVCRTVKREIIKEGVGLFSCLGEKKFDSLEYVIQGGVGSTGCHHKVTLAKKLSGNLRLNLWGIDVGPSGSWGDSYIYDIVFAAPPPKKK
jgi:hypothetical protein